MRREDETHAAAGHAAEHPEAPEVAAELGLAFGDELFGEVVRGPRNDRLERLAEVARGRRAERLDVAALQRRDHFVEHAEGILAAEPFGVGTEQVFLRHHFKDGPDVLGHAAVDDDERIHQRLAGGLGNFVAREDVVHGHEPAA